MLSLDDLENGDQAVWVGRGDANGHFTISERPRRQLPAHLVGRAAELHPQLVNVTVSNGEAVDLGSSR